MPGGQGPPGGAPPPPLATLSAGSAGPPPPPIAMRPAPAPPAGLVASEPRLDTRARAAEHRRVVNRTLALVGVALLTLALLALVQFG